MSNEISIREMLKNDFGVDLPISGGWGNTIENAVIVHYGIPNDYVSVEHSYLKLLGMGRQVSWKRIQQQLLTVGDRKYDKLKIEVTQETESEISTTIENYYFDITDCFGK
ncbi:hypothetical protein [Geomobilimonas luticola]|uniref:Uncharacterized protein n=1 Tax=Geomobilimonas luticola TaxID=1114878 RepID=A0ABS5SFA6_9BACT|nr:hypothetical protein [Geomobilimonas luticola]MBT0653357.1 hypothetical protein [Geomobilimonas luticola]